MRRLFCRATLSLLIGASCSLCACSSQAPTTGGAAGGVGTTVGCRPSDGDIYVAGIKKAGTAGRFDFALVGSTPSPPAQGDNLFVVQVIDANGDAAFGELSVTLEMPEHGHPSPKQPEIRFDAESEKRFSSTRCDCSWSACGVSPSASKARRRRFRSLIRLYSSFASTSALPWRGSARSSETSVSRGGAHSEARRSCRSGRVLEPVIFDRRPESDRTVRATK